MMRGKITKLAIGIFVLVIMLVIITLLTISAVNELLPNKKTAQSYYNSVRDSLEVIVQYLSESDADWLITEEKPYREKIDDSEVVEALDKLFNDGCLEIGKQGNTIYFLRWTRWKDFGAGLAYTVKDGVRPKVAYITGYEPLSQARWYYYETG